MNAAVCNIIVLFRWRKKKIINEFNHQLTEICNNSIHTHCSCAVFNIFTFHKISTCITMVASISFPLICLFQPIRELDTILCLLAGIACICNSGLSFHNKVQTRTLSLSSPCHSPPSRWHIKKVSLYTLTLWTELLYISFHHEQIHIHAKCTREPHIWYNIRSMAQNTK